MLNKLFFHCFISVLITLSIFIIVVNLNNSDQPVWTLSFFGKENLHYIWKYYEKNLRGNLFAGLISVSAFLMTGMTFILITMKQHIFDDDAYIQTFKKLKKHDDSLKLYTPLIELKNLLYLSVVATLVAAITQFTIGLIPHWSSAMISILLSIFSIILVFDSLLMMKNNLDAWLSYSKE